MKINLLYGSDNILSGYLNIDHIYENDKKTKGRIDNLDEICEDAECESIIADNVIDFFSSNEVSNIIEHWTLKLRHGGKIIITGVDIGEIAHGLASKQLNLTNANILLFGNQQKEYEFKKSAITLYDLCNALEQCGLRIIKKRISNYSYSVEAERL